MYPQKPAITAIILIRQFSGLTEPVFRGIITNQCIHWDTSPVTLINTHPVKSQHVQKCDTNYDNWVLMNRRGKKMSHLTPVPPDIVIKIYDRKEAKHL